MSGSFAFASDPHAHAQPAHAPPHGAGAARQPATKPGAAASGPGGGARASPSPARTPPASRLTAGAAREGRAAAAAASSGPAARATAPPPRAASCPKPRPSQRTPPNSNAPRGDWVGPLENIPPPRRPAAFAPSRVLPPGDDDADGGRDSWLRPASPDSNSNANAGSKPWSQPDDDAGNEGVWQPPPRQEDAGRVVKGRRGGGGGAGLDAPDAFSNGGGTSDGAWDKPPPRPRRGAPAAAAPPARAPPSGRAASPSSAPIIGGFSPSFEPSSPPPPQQAAPSSSSRPSSREGLHMPPSSSRFGQSVSLGHGASSALPPPSPDPYGYDHPPGGPPEGRTASASAAMTSSAPRATHGSSGAVPAASAKELARLQAENAQLRDQLDHYKQLLEASGGGGAAAGGDAGGGRAGATRGGRPGPGAGGEDLAAAGAAGVVLQRYKAQVVQLQRQVALMAMEMEAKGRLVAEAEGALVDVVGRMEELAGTGSSKQQQQQQVDGGGGGDAGLGREQLAGLQRWARALLGRLRSERSQSSKLLMRQGMDQSLGARSGGGGGLWDDAPGASSIGGGTCGATPAWHVPFVAAGGNEFLLLLPASADAAAGPPAARRGSHPGDVSPRGGGRPAAAAAGSDAYAAGGAGGAPGGPQPTVAHIAAGRCALLADPAMSHRLELQLACLAPKLAALAVLLRTQLLPAMPWLGMEASDRLQGEVGEAAEAVAGGARGLVQLCCLLPAGTVHFGDAPAAQEARRRAAEVDAGRNGWLFTSPEAVAMPQDPKKAAAAAHAAALAALAADDGGGDAGGGDGGGPLSVPRLVAALGPLLKDRKPASVKALQDILEVPRRKVQALAAARAVLESELRFACRAAAVHAEHVSHLIASVGMALQDARAAKDEASIRAYFAASTAMRALLDAADSLQRHPCEPCLKGVVDALNANKTHLDAVPELLVNAPAADVEGRLMAKLDEVHEAFKKAISRLDAHKRRYMDTYHAGQQLVGPAVEAEQRLLEAPPADAPPAAAGHGAGTGAAASRSSAPPPQQQQPLAGGKAVKPRAAKAAAPAQEWVD